MTAYHPQNSTFPNAIMLDKWADTGFFWQGTIELSNFDRLIEHIQDDHQKDTLHLTLNLKKTEGILWLSYEISGMIWVLCQRCLLPMDINVSNKYHIALLTHQDQSCLIDEDKDYILLDELNLTDTHKLPIKVLIEDELLLTLPLSPRHLDCQTPIDTSDHTPNTDTHNPFAILASLKNS